MRGQAFYIDPALGLNTRDSVLSMESQYTPDCLNVIAGQDGSIRKRDCCPNLQTVFAGAGANQLQTLHASNKLGFMITSANTFIYSVSIVGGVTDITGAAVIPINSDFAIVDAATSGGQGPVYLMPSSPIATVPQQWTGAGNVAAWTASAGTLLQGDYMVYFKNRMIMAGSRVGTNGSGVIASKVGDPRAWDTTLVGSSEAWLTNMDPFDGEAITGLGVVGAYLLVFKAHKIFIVYDLDTGANRPLSTSIGLTAAKTIQNTPYGTVFIATDGHMYLTDGSTLNKLSDVVDDTGYATIQQTAGPAFRDTPSLCGVYYNNHYYINRFNSVSQYCLDYNFDTKTWWRHSNSFNAATIFTASTQFVSKLYTSVSNTGGSLSPVVRCMYEANVADGFIKDGTSTYQAQLTSIPLAPAFIRRKIVQNYTVRRRYHAIRGYVTGTVDLTTFLNRTAPVTTQASYSAVTNTLPVTVYSLGVAYSLTVKWDSTNANTWRISPWAIYTQPRAD